MAETVKRGPSRLSSSRHNAADAAPKSSQSGYGHKLSRSGSTTPQGRGKHAAKKGVR